MRYADRSSHDNNLDVGRQRRGVDQAVPPGYYSTPAYPSEGLPYPAVAAAYLQQQQVTVDARNYALAADQLPPHRQPQYQYQIGAFHHQLEHHDSVGRVAYPDVHTHLQYYGHVRQEELGAVAMRMGGPHPGGYDSRHPEQPLADPLQGIMQNLAIAQERKQQQHSLRYAGGGRAAQFGGFAESERRNPKEESERYTEIYQEVFARHSRTPSEARTPTEHTQARSQTPTSQTPTSTSDSTSATGTSEGSSSSTENEWEENIMSALNDMAGNLKNIGGIQCNQAGPDSTEVQLKLNLPVPIHFMNHLDIAAKQGFNTAIQTLSPKKCNYQFDYSHLDDQVFDMEERFMGTIDQLQGKVMPVYKSLFENQSGSSDEDEDQVEETRRQMSDDSSDTTYEDKRFLPKLSAEKSGSQKGGHVVMRLTSAHTTVQDDVVRSIAATQTVMRIPSHIIIAESPSDFSSNDSWVLSSPRDKLKDKRPLENIPPAISTTMPFEVTGIDKRNRIEAVGARMPHPSIKVSKSLDEVGPRHIPTGVMSPLSQRNVTTRDPDIGAFRNSTNSPDSLWIPATRGQIDVVDREPLVTEEVEEEQAPSTEPSADPVTPLVQEKKRLDHIPEIKKERKISAQTLPNSNTSSEIPTAIFFNLNPVDGFEIVESFSDLTMGLGESMPPQPRISTDDMLAITEFPAVKTSFSGDELMRGTQPIPTPPSPELDELLGPFEKKRNEDLPSTTKGHFMNVTEPFVPEGDEIMSPATSDCKPEMISPKLQGKIASIPQEPEGFEPSNPSILHHTTKSQDRVNGTPKPTEVGDEIMGNARTELEAKPKSFDHGISSGSLLHIRGSKAFQTSTEENRLNEAASRYDDPKVGVVTGEKGSPKTRYTSGDTNSEPILILDADEEVPDDDEVPDDELDIAAYTSLPVQYSQPELSPDVAKDDVPDDETMISPCRISSIDGRQQTLDSTSQERQTKNTDSDAADFEDDVPEDEVKRVSFNSPRESEGLAQSGVKQLEERDLVRSVNDHLSDDELAGKVAAATNPNEASQLSIFPEELPDDVAPKAAPLFEIADFNGDDGDDTTSFKHELAKAENKIFSLFDKTLVSTAAPPAIVTKSDNTEQSRIRYEDYEAPFDIPLEVSKTNRTEKSDHEISLSVTNASSDISFRSALEDATSEHSRRKYVAISTIETPFEEGSDGAEDEDEPFDATFEAVGEKLSPKTRSLTSINNTTYDGPFDVPLETAKMSGNDTAPAVSDQSVRSSSESTTSFSRILDVQSTNECESNKTEVDDEIATDAKAFARVHLPVDTDDSPFDTDFKGCDAEGAVGKVIQTAGLSRNDPTPGGEETAIPSEKSISERIGALDRNNEGNPAKKTDFELGNSTDCLTESLIQQLKVDEAAIESSTDEIVDNRVGDKDPENSDIDDAETLISQISGTQRSTPDYNIGISIDNADNTSEDGSEPGMIVSRHSREPTSNDGPSSSVGNENSCRSGTRGRSVDEGMSGKTFGSHFEPSSLIDHNKTSRVPSATHDIVNQHDSIEQTTARNEVEDFERFGSISGDRGVGSCSLDATDIPNSDRKAASKAKTSKLHGDDEDDHDDRKCDGRIQTAVSRTFHSQHEDGNSVKQNNTNGISTKTFDEVGSPKNESSLAMSRNARDRASLYQVQGFADYCKKLSVDNATDEKKTILEKLTGPTQNEIERTYVDASAKVAAVQVKIDDKRDGYASDDDFGDDSSRSRTSSQSGDCDETNSDSRDQGSLSSGRSGSQSRASRMSTAQGVDTCMIDDDAGMKSGSRSRTLKFASSTDDEQSDIHTNFTSDSEDEENSNARDIVTETDSRKEMSTRPLRNEIDVWSERVEIRYLTEHTRSKNFLSAAMVNASETKSIVTMDDAMHSTQLLLAKDPTRMNGPPITYQRSRTPKSIATSYSIDTPLTSPLTSSFTMDTPLASALTMSTMRTFDQETIYSEQHSIRRQMPNNETLSSVFNSFHSEKPSSTFASLGVTPSYLTTKRSNQHFGLLFSSNSPSSSSILINLIAWIQKFIASIVLFVFAWTKHLSEGVMGKKRSVLKIGCSPAGLDMEPEQVMRREEIQDRGNDTNRRHQQHHRVGSHSNKPSPQYSPRQFQRHQHTTVMMTTMPMMTNSRRCPPYDTIDDDDDADEVGTCVESIVPDAHFPSDAEGRPQVSNWTVISPQTYGKSSSSRSLGPLKMAYSAFSSSASSRRQPRKGHRGEEINWVMDDEDQNDLYDDASSYCGGASIR